MITIVDKKGDLYTIKDSYGNTSRIYSALLKDYMSKGLVVSNAHLSPSGRLMRDPENTNKSADIRDYRRTECLVNASFQQKTHYYWDFLVHKCIDLSVLTIDELDCVFCASLNLETGDLGSSRVDERLSRDLYTFPTLARLFRELQDRGYLTENEIREYILGTDKTGRYINNYSLTYWILSHKK